MSRVTIIDYGMGNLLSVVRAFEHACKTDVSVTESPEMIDQSNRLVLPGVGAFADGMRELSKRRLIEPIRKYAKSGRPFLGICLGMQMMLEESEEFGRHEGLGMIQGKAVSLSLLIKDTKNSKIPHVGWNSLHPPSIDTKWDSTILDGITPGAFAYFSHSYAAQLAHDKHCLAVTHYGGSCIVASISSGPLYGLQFHPEKSGALGLKLIETFFRT